MAFPTRSGFASAARAGGVVAAGWLALGPAAWAAGAALTASGAWSRPTVSAAMGGVIYMTVKDSGAPTALLGVSTPIAARAAMHRSLLLSGVMEMLPVPSLAIAPGAPIIFSPGGYHIMLTGLGQPLSTGERFPVTLTFADGRRVTTTVTVQAMMAPPQGGGMAGMKAAP